MKLRRLWVALSIVTILIPLALTSGCSGKGTKKDGGKTTKTNKGTSQTTD